MKKIISLSILFMYAVCFIQCSSQRTNLGTQNPPKVKNIIFIIGDGMGVAQVYAGLTANKGHLNLEQCQYTGFSKTYSANNYITDSAAGGTALACGVKTNNGVIGMDTSGKPVKSMLEYAEENGLATGIVVTSSVTNATPASFIAHQASRKMEEEIAADYLKTDIDVFVGGGRKFFETRTDSQNLTDQLKSKNYKIAYTIEDVKNTQSGKLVGLLAEEHMPSYTKGRGNMLPEAVQSTINILSKNDKGFFLMVEGSQIDFEAHGNNSTGIINEMLDFDRAVKVAFDFASKNPQTLVIITADHETSGMSLIGGDIAKGEVSVNFARGGHTAIMVPVFVYGANAQNFSGIYENTSFFPKVLDLLNIERK